MSGIKVTVLSGDVDERGGTFEDDSGKERSYTTRKQKCRLEVAGFAYPYELRLEDGQKPYQPGDYDLDVESMLQVNKGTISLSKFGRLKPRHAAARAA